MNGGPQRRDREAAPAGAALDRYRMLFDLAPVAYLITDRDGGIVEANESAARLFGVDRRFLVGKPLPLYADDASQRLLRRFVRAVAAGTPRHATLRLRRRSGVTFDAEIDAVAGAGEVRWIVQDVSAQRLAEEQLWELNRALEEEVRLQAGELVTVLEELPVGVVVVDAATRTIRRMNARAQEATGVGPGESLEALEALGADGRPLPRRERASEQALAGRRVEGSRIRLRSADGVETELELSGVPLRGPDGEITGAVLTTDDVTARARRERAERDFVSNAAHQLRSPLTAISGAVTVLRSDPALDGATRTRFLDHVERETDRMVRLTHGLLTLARLERDGVRPRPAVVPVGPLLARLAEAAAEEGAAATVDADEGAAVLANEDLLVEALTNLLVNAIVHGGGDIALRGRRTDDHVVLEVADRGCGMDTEAVERAFDRFYRAEGARAGGFGLGLAIARAAARGAGGDLTIESEPGVGTTARVRLAGARLLADRPGGR